MSSSTTPAPPTAVLCGATVPRGRRALAVAAVGIMAAIAPAAAQADAQIGGNDPWNQQPLSVHRPGLRVLRQRQGRTQGHLRRRRVGQQQGRRHVHVHLEHDQPRRPARGQRLLTGVHAVPLGEREGRLLPGRQGQRGPRLDVRRRRHGRVQRPAPVDDRRRQGQRPPARRRRRRHASTARRGSTRSRAVAGTTRSTAASSTTSSTAASGPTRSTAATTARSRRTRSARNPVKRRPHAVPARTARPARATTSCRR